MKYPLFAYNLIVNNLDRKLRRTHKEYEAKEVREDISYFNDDLKAHKMDIFYPKTPAKVPLILNIHGGAYYSGHKESSSIFCSYFANKGLYVVSPNYSLVNGKNEITVKTQIHEMIMCLKYVIEHKEELNLNYSGIYVMGDSAGGHHALMMALALQNNELKEYYNIDLDFNPDVKGYILSTPMFDFEGLVPVGQKLLFKGGVKAIFSKYYLDKEFLRKNSPKTHLNEGVKFPKLMLLYSKGDVFIEQSNLLKERLDSLKLNYQLYFEENEKAIHVFHHYHISSDMSKKANNAIIEFTKD